MRKSRKRRPPDSTAARIGKDELNLVEFPFALLADRADPSQKTIKTSWLVSDGEGGWIACEQIVTGSDEFGLPIAGDMDIYLILLEITKESGFKSPTINISRYEIIRRLKGGKEYRDNLRRGVFQGADYQRVKDALSRLAGVTIYSSRWYDKTTRRHTTDMFHILERASISDETPGKDGQPPLPMSSITWDKVLFKNFEAGNLKNLNLDRYLGLRTAIAKSLFRLLDKRFYDGKPKFEIGLRYLAHEHLGMSRNYKYDSVIKAKMQNAHEELVAAGIISGYDFRKTPEGLIAVYYAPKDGPPRLPLPEPIEAPPALMLPVPQAECNGHAGGEEILRQLVEAGVSRDAAEALAEKFPEDRIREKLSYLPYADAKNPGGWLRRAVEGDWQAPPAYRKAQKERERTERAREAGKKRGAPGNLDREKEARVEAFLSSLPEEERRRLRERAEALARERYPTPAQLADRGKGRPAWEKLIRSTLEQLLLEGYSVDDVEP